MSKVIYCLISLLLANLMVEHFREISNYEDAIKTTWSQMWALIIYHFIWED